jgi:hypothetical protein
MTHDRHGTEYRYKSYSCRCQPCKSAHAWRQAKNVAERAEMIKADPSLRPHGNASTYKNWGCRCQPCKDAGNAQRRAADEKRGKSAIGKRVVTRAKRSYAHLRIKPFGREWLAQ